MPELLLIDAKYEKPIKLSNNLKIELQRLNPKSIALFASVQFSDINNFIKEIENLEIKVNLTKAKRTDDKLQILGCDCYSDSFSKPIIQNSELILYVGDGMFHPKAILLSQIKEKNPKPLLVFDPIGNKVELLDKKIIENQLRRAKRNLKLFLNKDSIGILVTIKPGQQYLTLAKKLKENLEKQGKKAYIFIDDFVGINQLENFHFVDVWVNTACPRIGTDDIVNIKQAMINIKEANNPIKALEDLEQWNSI